MMNLTRNKPSCRGRISRLLAATLALAALTVPASGFAAVQARLDRTRAQAGDVLTLTIVGEGTPSGAQPDVTPLHKDFQVLGTSTSSEVSIINGSRSDRTRWLVQLQPLHAGVLGVPPISVGNEHTAALRIDVAEASAQTTGNTGRHVFLEAEAAAAGKPIYVQQQIPYTVKLYFDDTIRSGELTAPDTANAIVEQLGEDKRYTAFRGGREYNVIERHYAIAPEKSGTQQIPPAGFRGTAMLPQSIDDDTDPADAQMNRLLKNTPFANDPFFKQALGSSTLFAGAGQQVGAQSKPIVLQVQPRPASAQGNWLPAEQITLHDSWEGNPPQFKAGEPVTRTITIEAKGLAATQIPALVLAQPAGTRLYAETADNQSRTDGDAIYGISKQSTTYIPSSQGAIDIPAVELVWWNTHSNTQSLATLPARQFTVEAGAPGTQAANVPTAGNPGISDAPSTAVNGVPGEAGQHIPLADRLRDHWEGLAAGFTILAAILVSALLIRRRIGGDAKTAPELAGPQPEPRRKSIMSALQRACLANQGHAAALLLLDLARLQWPANPPRGLRALAERLAVGKTEILVLDRSLYGTVGAVWEGAALWEAIQCGLQPKSDGSMQVGDGLPALYLSSSHAIPGGKV
jgi:hypothetical protein